MKTIIEFLFTLAAIFVIYGCSEDDNDTYGNWAPMKWQAEQDILNEDGVYIIATDGDTVSFVCTNYSSPWMCGANVDNEYIGCDDLYKSIEGKWFTAFFYDNRLSVIFEKNTESARNVELIVTAGDIFDYFYFMQQGE